VKEELEALIEEAKEEEKYFKNYLKYARKIKKEAETLLGKVKVFVFGSILRKDEVARDIDILIISPKLKTTAQKSKILAKLWKKFGFNIPFEFHLINPDEYKNWYRYFIKEKIEIK
jgi:predicted nucleotidyltransferase